MKIEVYHEHLKLWIVVDLNNIKLVDTSGGPMISIGFAGWTQEQFNKSNKKRI